MTPAPHIGTLGEKPLHASLKQWYARPGDRIEVPVDGFVIDLVRGDRLIEIQTRGFAAMKRKVDELLRRGHALRIVHPVPVDKWIVKVDDEGAVLGRRRSPKHGRAIDFFAELVSFPGRLLDPRLEVDVVLTEEEEYRRHRPGRARRRGGWAVEHRRLLRVVDTLLIRGAGGIEALLPEGLPDPFTTADLARGLSCARRLAQQMAYCLRATGVAGATGKRGNAVLYRLGRTLRHPMST